jgi:hypothetical protein
MLLFGIFRNCLNKEGPPPQPETQSKKRGRDGDEDSSSVSTPDAKRKRLKEIIMGLPRDERERIKDIAKVWKFLFIRSYNLYNLLCKHIL